MLLVDGKHSVAQSKTAWFQPALHGGSVQLILWIRAELMACIQGGSLGYSVSNKSLVRVLKYLFLWGQVAVFSSVG